MPIPSFDELFRKRADYFESRRLAEWETATEEKNKSLNTRTATTQYLIQEACKACIPNDSDYDESNFKDKSSFIIYSLEKCKTNITALLKQGQLAFLWAHINEILTTKKSYFSHESEYTEDERTYTRHILTEIKATLLEKMQNSENLKDLIHKQAFLCADLSGMFLTSMLLNTAKLSHANLSHCRFNNTSLIGAKLKEADLGNADLTDVLGNWMYKSDKVSGLFNVNLRGANLSGAKYKHADIMAVETSPPKGNFHQTRFGILPDSYDKNPAEKQALENKIRESYAAVITENHRSQYDATFLKLIQASGFSPLTWGDRPEAFEEEHRKWTERDFLLLLTQMKRTLGEMVDPNDERGYMKSRSRDAFKNLFFKLKESRSGQLGELARLKNTNDFSMDELRIDKIANGLLKVSSAIRLEDNKLRSELLNQIENACKHPEVRSLEL